MVAQRKWIWWLALVCVSVWPVASARSADEDEPAPSDEINRYLKLDLHQLIVGESVFVTSVSDEVWTVSARPGHSLIQIPLTIESADKDFDLTTSSVRLLGGRVLVWRIAWTEKELASDAGDMQGKLPEGAPRLVRRLTVRADGKVSYRLDRFLPNGDITGRSRYAMKIKPELLNAHNPGEPPSTSRRGGEDERSHRTRILAEQAAYRERSTAYRELRKQVFELPNEVECPLPPRLWAVCEVRGEPRDFSVSGPEDTPWTIQWKTLQALRLAVSVDVLDAEGKLGPNVGEVVRTLYGQVASSPHPLTFRAVAYALSPRRIISHAQPGDVLSQLCELTLKGPDAQARNVVIKELVSTFPPTPGTRALIGSALPDMDASAKLLSLGSMLKANIEQPGAQFEASSLVAKMLGDKAGPPPAQIVAKLVESAAVSADAARQMAQQVRLSAMPDDRVDAFIRAVVEKAPENELAATWLDQLFLGAPDSRVVHKTLEVIGSAEIGGAGFRPVVGRAMGALFGGDRSASSQAIRLSRPILISSPTHNMFRALQSGDGRVRALAWTTLPYFTFGYEPVLPPMTGQADRRYRQLTLAALGQSPTPTQAVDFLVHQPDAILSAAELIEIALAGSGEAALQSARSLVGFPAPLPALFAQRSYNERQSLAGRLYQATRGKVPLAIAVLRQRQDNNPVLAWFASEVVAGRVPDASEWAAAFRSLEELYELIPSNDTELAGGAVAVLVASVGGDDPAAVNLLQVLRAQENTTVPALAQEWGKHSRSLFADRLQRATGDHRVTISFHPRHAAAPVDPAQQTSQADLGVIRVLAGGEHVEFEGRDIRLSVSDSRAAIQIEQPIQLRALAVGRDLDSVPLDSVPAPLYLVPWSDSTWRCRFDLIDGRRAELVFTPTGPRAAADRSAAPANDAANAAP